MTTSEEYKVKRTKIAAKVRALLSKTTERGCTEAEALAAAKLASELMKEHDLAYGDIQAEVAAEVFGARNRHYRTKGHDHPIAVYCSVPVAAYWDCKVWRSTKDHSVVFFGEQSDTESAHLMLAMLCLAGDTEFASFWNSSKKPFGVHYKTGCASFLHGMAYRVGERLGELKAQRTHAGATGTSLVVVKDRVVKEKFNIYQQSSGLTLSKRGGKPSIKSRAAYGAGKEAGDRIDLGAGQRVEAGARQISS